MQYLVKLNGTSSAVLNLLSRTATHSLFATTTCDAMLISPEFCECGDNCLSLTVSRALAKRFLSSVEATYSLNAVVLVQVPLTVYGSSSAKVLYKSLASNWQSSDASGVLEAGITALDASIIATTISSGVASSYTTMNVPDSSESNSLSGGAISGIVIGSAVVVLLLLGSAIYALRSFATRGDNTGSREHQESHESREGPAEGIAIDTIVYDKMELGPIEVAVQDSILAEDGNDHVLQPEGTVVIQAESVI